MRIHLQKLKRNRRVNKVLVIIILRIRELLKNRKIVVQVISGKETNNTLILMLTLKLMLTPHKVVTNRTIKSLIMIQLHQSRQLKILLKAEASAKTGYVDMEPFKRQNRQHNNQSLRPRIK